MDNKDVVLLVVHAAGEVMSPVQLQKAVFLVCEAKSGLKSTYSFEPFHYGPFDIQVYNDADQLHEEGLVRRIPSSAGSWTDTLITPEGAKRVMELRATLPETTVAKLDRLLKIIQGLSFEELVGAVYKAFPEYKKNSLFRFSS